MLRKTVYEVSPDGSLKQLLPQSEYSLFEESVYLCSLVSVNTKGAKRSHVYLWTGSSSSLSAYHAAESAGKKIARETTSTLLPPVHQGHEPPAFFNALGGIAIIRRGSSDSATKQYMLCGRKHLGHIAFDEVDFGIDSLCAGFAYLISYPITLQETKLYLWKGSCASPEEVGAARLVAMDLSETGEVIEVDDGAEFASFLKIFGPGTTKADVIMPTMMWQRKAQEPDKWTTRLFRIQRAETKSSLFTSVFVRRPSWNGRSPSRPAADIMVEAIEVSPFMQSDLEAEGIYLLDGYGSRYLLVGPLFASQAGAARNALLGQALLFASDYAKLSTSFGERAPARDCAVVFSGIPSDVKMLFRHWDEGHGLWGSAALMAGSSTSLGELKTVPLEDVLRTVV